MQGTGLLNHVTCGSAQHVHHDSIICIMVQDYPVQVIAGEDDRAYVRLPFRLHTCTAQPGNGEQPGARCSTSTVMHNIIL
jgi:hypothetical protein